MNSPHNQQTVCFPRPLESTDFCHFMEHSTVDCVRALQLWHSWMGAGRGGCRLLPANVVDFVSPSLHPFSPVNLSICLNLLASESHTAAMGHNQLHKIIKKLFYYISPYHHHAQSLWIPNTKSMTLSSSCYILSTIRLSSLTLLGNVLYQWKSPQR